MATCDFERRLRPSIFAIHGRLDVGPIAESHGKSWEVKQNPDVANLEESIDYKIIYSGVDEKPKIACKCLKDLVGANGFEPSTSWSRTRRASQAALRPD
jgi:hypothetical protein